MVAAIGFGADLDIGGMAAAGALGLEDDMVAAIGFGADLGIGGMAAAGALDFAAESPCFSPTPPVFDSSSFLDAGAKPNVILDVPWDSPEARPKLLFFADCPVPEISPNPNEKLELGFASAGFANSLPSVTLSPPKPNVKPVLGISM